MSGASKIGALCVTYPYQVIRSRIQVRGPSFCALAHPRANADLLSAAVDVDRPGTGAHAPSHHPVDDRAYVGARGLHGVLPRPGYEPRARASRDVRYVRGVRKYCLAAQARCRETRSAPEWRRGQSVMHL